MLSAATSTRAQLAFRNSAADLTMAFFNEHQEQASNIQASNLVPSSAPSSPATQDARPRSLGGLACSSGCGEGLR